MDELNPIYRIEFFLDAIVNNTTPPDPIYRAEFYLAKIAGADVEIPEPVYRMEKYLAYLCGEEVELPDPIYRIEYYLAFLCGLNVELPEPIYRIEFWLWDWCGGGGIEKTVTGNPIHILDALAKPVQALSVKLEPIQDLHGYDSPWPAGGGVNKADASAFVHGTLQGGTGAILSSSSRITSDYIPVDENVQYYAFVDSDKYVYEVCAYASDKSFILLFAKINASSGTFTTPANTAYVRFSVRYPDNGDLSPYNLTQAFCAKGGVQSYSPYSNICPISGHTDADVTRTGKNLIDFDDEAVAPVFDFNTKYNTSAYWGSVKFKENTQYTLSCTANTSDTTNAWGIHVYYTDGTDNYLWIHRNTTNNPSVTTASGKTVSEIIFAYSSLFQLGFSNAMFEEGATATAYSPYVGTTYPIPLGQTVYGGTLDVLTGVLTILYGLADLSSIIWHADTNRPGVFYGAISGRKLDSDLGLCDTYATKNITVSTSYDMYISGSVSYGGSIVFLRDTRYAGMTGEQFRAVASGHVVYELATHTTIQLTPQQVELLQGENNIWSDGTMTLVYLADGNASDVEALNILLGNRYVNNHTDDEPTDREALDILLGR